jgi:hypothetical protein
MAKPGALPGSASGRKQKSVLFGLLLDIKLKSLPRGGFLFLQVRLNEIISALYSGATALGVLYKLSAFEVLTITFSFIVGLGVAQVLKSVAYIARESHQIDLHWIPFSVAGQILFFQVQFWFALTVVNSLMEKWSWSVYASMLLLAILIGWGNRAAAFSYIPGRPRIEGRLRNARSNQPDISGSLSGGLDWSRDHVLDTRTLAPGTGQRNLLAPCPDDLRAFKRTRKDPASLGPDRDHHLRVIHSVDHAQS